MRDREDFRSLGADEAIMNAIEACGSRAMTVQIAPTRSRVIAQAGGVATVVFRVTRARQPAEGVGLALRGSGALPGGRGSDARAFSNADGNAVFRVPVGTVTGTYPLTAGPIGEERIEGNPAITLVVTAAGAAGADVSPDRLLIQRGQPGQPQVTVVLRDPYGNIVTGQSVELRPESPAMGIGEVFEATNERGQVVFTIDALSIHEPGRLGIFVGSDELASVEVTLVAGAVAADQTGFVAGVDQAGAVGATLPSPLVFQVRDASGMPIGRQQVVFTADNARVDPPVAMTDTAGQVRAIVHLGNDARPATIAALVDGQRVETTIRVVAGPATELTVTHDGAPIVGDLIITKNEPVMLQVSARDAFGNTASVADLRATIENERVLRLVGVSADTRGARVALEPRTDGLTSLRIEAAGLSERVTAQLFLSQRPYFTGYTSLYGSGMIFTNHALIAPGPGDFALVAGAAFPDVGGARAVDEGGSAILSWRGRAEIGLTAYTPSEFGVPVKVLLLPASRPGLSFAVGALDLIPTADDIGRQGALGLGEVYTSYIDRASPYLIGSWSRRTTASPVGFLLSVGWGAGMFLEDNPAYSRKGYTSGFFGSAALDAEASPGVVFRLMLEHDGWDTNAAGTLSLYGIEVTLGLLAIDEAGADENSNALNQMRFFGRIAATLNQSRAWLGF